MYEYSVTPLESPPPLAEPEIRRGSAPQPYILAEPRPVAGIGFAKNSCRSASTTVATSPGSAGGCCNTPKRGFPVSAAPQNQKGWGHLSGADGTGQVEDADGLAEWVAVFPNLCDSQALEFRIGVPRPDLRMEMSGTCAASGQTKTRPPPPPLPLPS